MNKNLKKLILSAIFLSLCIVLPFITGQIPEIGSMISPMHIPVFICGIICGWQYGFAIGFIAPIMRWMIFSMPPMPSCIAMAFELSTYGIVIGIIYKALPKKTIYTYISLLLSMLAGRLMWGAAQWCIIGLSGGTFTFRAFLAGAILESIPGIILHLILIPLIIFILKKAKLIPNE